MRVVPALVLSLFLVASYSANAEAQPDAIDATQDADPLSGFNHPVFSFNIGFDRYVLKPVATTYHHVPDIMRLGIANFLSNLGEPLNAIHGVLQLNPRIAFGSFWRFVLNTTFGLGGLRDFAGEDAGIHNMDQNLGKTFGRWGIAAGPYIVLPVFGPSSLRDTVGRAGDFFMDPVTWDTKLSEDIALGVADGIEARDENAQIIDHLYYESLDPYVATRSTYRQHEAFEVEKKE